VPPEMTLGIVNVWTVGESRQLLDRSKNSLGKLIIKMILCRSSKSHLCLGCELTIKKCSCANSHN
jgi:hypothetical protein